MLPQFVSFGLGFRPLCLLTYLIGGLSMVITLLEILPVSREITKGATLLTSSLDWHG